MQARDINFNLHGYMVLELLGSGAMGDVFKCIDRSTGQLVAIKWLHRLEMAKRFANEADTLGRISHPNIAQFIDYIHTQDYAFIVMEYVEGLTIEKLIRHSG
ncbi:MAG: protein kinase, partial [Saprospiraceae bacterium]|nr:protein kinase [Saprospiraceae bacterium]